MYKNDPKAVAWIEKYYERLKESPATRYRKKQKLKLYTILGGFICVECGETREKCLQIDHKKGSMKLDLKRFGNYKKMLKYYIDNPEIAKDILQILCANCNWFKR